MEPKSGVSTLRYAGVIDACYTEYQLIQGYEILAVLGSVLPLCFWCLCGDPAFVNLPGAFVSMVVLSVTRMKATLTFTMTLLIALSVMTLAKDNDGDEQ